MFNLIRKNVKTRLCTPKILHGDKMKLKLDLAKRSSFQVFKLELIKSIPFMSPETGFLTIPVLFSKLTDLNFLCFVTTVFAWQSYSGEFHFETYFLTTRYRNFKKPKYNFLWLWPITYGDSFSPVKTLSMAHNLLPINYWARCYNTKTESGITIRDMG